MRNTVHITRQPDLIHQEGANEISLEEWMAFVARDPDMRLDNYTTVTLQNGEEYRYANPGAAVILHRESGQLNAKEVTADFSGGNIVVNYYSPKLMEKIRHIAYKLNAQIFIESKSWTEQVAVEQPVVKPRFRFMDAFNPIRKSIPQLRYFFSKLTFAFSKHNEHRSEPK
jgi:hypothetical protein